MISSHSSRQLQRGQALLFVVVAMVIVLTVSLSAATRSIVNVRTSNEEASSQQAFSAAEAGVERYLKTGNIFSDTVGQANVAVTSQAVSGSDLTLNNGNPVLRDAGVDLWLSSFPDYTAPFWSGVMTIRWGSTSDCNAAALEVVVISGTSITNAVISKTAFDPCADRRTTNNFAASTPAGGSAYVNQAQVTVTNGLLARIIPLYKNTTIRVTGGSAFPTQGTKIESVGSLGDTRRKITVYQGYPMIPNEFFSHVLFSP